MGSGLSMASVNKIKELAESRNYDVAVDILDSQDLEKSLNPQFVRTCGEIYENVGRFADARKQYVRAHIMAASNSRVIQSLIVLYLKRGFKTLAEKYYEHYVFVEKNNERRLNDIKYIMLKAEGDSYQEMYDLIFPYYRDNMDEDWSFELILLAMKMDKDDLDVIISDYMATFKNSKNIDMLYEIIQDKDMLDKYLNIFSKKEAVDDDPVEEEVRKLEAEQLEKDYYVRNPKDPEILIMVDDTMEELTDKQKKKLHRKNLKEMKKQQMEAASGEEPGEGEMTEEASEAEDITREKKAENIKRSLKDLIKRKFKRDDVSEEENSEEAETEKAETEVKAETEKTESTEAKAETEKTETAEVKVETEKTETAEVKTETEKPVTAEAKAESEKPVTAEVKAEAEKPEVAEVKAEVGKPEVPEVKAEAGKIETAEDKAEYGSDKKDVTAATATAVSQTIINTSEQTVTDVKILEDDVKVQTAVQGVEKDMRELKPETNIDDLISYDFDDGFAPESDSIAELDNDILDFSNPFDSISAYKKDEQEKKNFESATLDKTLDDLRIGLEISNIDESTSNYEPEREPETEPVTETYREAEGITSEAAVEPDYESEAEAAAEPAYEAAAETAAETVHESESVTEFENAADMNREESDEKETVTDSIDLVRKVASSFDDNISTPLTDSDIAARVDAILRGNELFSGMDKSFDDISTENSEEISGSADSDTAFDSDTISDSDTAFDSDTASESEEASVSDTASDSNTVSVSDTTSDYDYSARIDEILGKSSIYPEPASESEAEKENGGSIIDKIKAAAEDSEISPAEESEQQKKDELSDDADKTDMVQEAKAENISAADIVKEDTKTITDHKDSLGYPEFKTSIFETTTEKNDIKNEFDEVVQKENEKLEEKLGKEEEMLKQAEALLASLGIKL
ncbi:hypothetical protein SAMN04487934_101400 [Eubacterium ruminantium]|nr:hypothetical protein SAMN04487934_101400 [Eubacterium ruminantium]